MICSLNSDAQKNKADQRFTNYQFTKAIPMYEKYLKSKPDDYPALKNLSSCYLHTNNRFKAIESFKIIVTLKESNADDLYQLIELLRQQQNNFEAKTYALKYRQHFPSNKAENLINSLEMFESLSKGNHAYEITNRTAKYPSSIYGAVKYKDKIVVTAAGKSKNAGPNYTDIFSTDTSFKKLKPFAKEIMTDLDDGIPTFTNNGNTVYYTTTYNENGNNTHKLKISVASIQAGKWIRDPDFPYNSQQYITAHPTIGVNGKLLVFSSDMPGGKGGMDLYICKLEGNTWSNPENLKQLNTADNEMFPVFTNAGDLIFASNGLPGLGAHDLFISKNNNTIFADPVNLKAPLNSAFDDFSLFTDDGMFSGYLSSNRFNDPVTDGVLHFKTKQNAPEEIVNTTGLVITVKDKYTLTPLPYVIVTIKDKSGQLIHQGLTDPAGQIVLDEIPKGDYTIQGTLNDVTTTSAKISAADFTGNSAIQKEILHNDPRFTLAGIAINTKTNAPLEGVLIKCNNVNTGNSKKTTTVSDGKFLFQLEQNSDFEVQGQKKGWLSSELAEKTTKGLDRSAQLYVNLEMKIEQPVNKGTITLKKIHYDYNKCDIRPDAAIELDRLVNLLRDYPDMVIELSSHTDSRGSDDYNLTLSQCRAVSAVNYLIKKGILKSRLSAKGYGETKLLNACLNDVECSDAQHEENRRTEFTILICNSCPK